MFRVGTALVRPVAAQSVRYSSNLAKNPVLVKTPEASLVRDQFDPTNPLKQGLFTKDHSMLLKCWIPGVPALAIINLNATANKPSNIIYHESSYSMYKKRKAAQLE